jgi:hypothetical protein
MLLSGTFKSATVADLVLAMRMNRVAVETDHPNSRSSHGNQIDAAHRHVQIRNCFGFVERRASTNSDRTLCPIC